MAPSKEKLPQPSAADLFDTMLPRELRLRIFQTVMNILDGSRTTQSSSQPSRGRRALFRLAQVSRTWQALAFDGMFWASLDVQSFGYAPGRQSLIRISKHAGSFVKTLRLSGAVKLTNRDLEEIVKSLSGKWGVTMISVLALDGCRALTASTLQDLLSKSPTLRHVSLAGLDSVTTKTISTLFLSSLQLTSLNVARCRSLQGSSLVRPTYRHVSTSLKRLNVSAISLDNDTVSEIPHAFPELTHLDLSYNKSIQDKGMEAFASSIKASKESHRPLRNMTHINLSGTGISDLCLKAMAGLFPNLEVLEMANTASTFDDDGLEIFLSSVPQLRKLDLEGSESLTDRILQRLSPAQYAENGTGSQLEHAVFNRCLSFSDEGFLRLIRQCPKLKILEVDNTRIRETTVKVFLDRQISNSEIVAIDCRAFSRTALPSMMHLVRPRHADERWKYRDLGYLRDSRMYVRLANPAFAS